MNAGFSVNAADKAAPFIGGSLQDVSGLTFVSGGLPFLVASQPPGPKYVNDSRGRLTQVNFTNGTQIVYSYDDMGNRTSVVTTAGPHGL
jgi:YD repeat-containing protein